MLRWRDGLVGAVMGGLVGGLFWAASPTMLSAVAMVYGCAGGLALSLFYGTRVADIVADLFTSL